MKLGIIGFDDKVIFDVDHPAILVIENAKLFANISLEMIKNVKGISDDNTIVLIDEKENLLTIAKDVKVISDVITLDFNDKKVLTKIYQRLINDINSDIEENMIISELFNKINNEIFKYSLDLDLDLMYESEISLNNYLKAINLEISSDCYKSIYDMIIQYIDYEAQLHLYKCTILINALIYLSKEQVIEILKYIQYKKVSVLFIERGQYDIMYENICVIDNDFIQII